ncbi:MAG: DUF488 domain-containing protein [Candidatus Dormibacteraeota bacterium]|nr:DUF488 domain-containing protein [Candidatus Dormibacteraeota bacterium]
MVTRIWTIGHSTRTLDEFVSLLVEHGVDWLADVRTLPGSRRFPQFDREALEPELARRGIGYSHLGSLGGLRKPSAGSPNSGWRNASFRGYADYMQTGPWRDGLSELLDLTRDHAVAVMCAEAVPWRCHRSLIADALTIRGVEVLHIVGKGRATRHVLTAFARVDGDRLTYPPDRQTG